MLDLQALPDLSLGGEAFPDAPFPEAASEEASRFDVVCG